ncbi:LysR family transcriptional regulator [Konateibacter massiliensis]|uniref:LysR family transcriptional regulator n=1 Tax=Konateibacter massiliensis TaxID=2002841 RepID=UPI000C15B855|nr:LysR family transcriptional regulator [Konateibacter massiliensis]
MEIRQLEYFVASVEEKSFYKASEKLYTSQPAVSKSIAVLEREINQKLFKRTSKGLKLTTHGERFYHHAKNVLRQIDIMKDTMLGTKEVHLTLASYPSKLISNALTAFYNEQETQFQLEYHEGSVQDMIDFVYKGICEFGILYIFPKQEQAFKHIMTHKHLEFVPMKECELCVYVGEKNKLYKSQKAITLEELSELQYIRGVRDFFSVEHHFDYVLNEINTAYFDDRVLTNSDHLVSLMLKKTDLCYLGIDTKGTRAFSKIRIDAPEKQLTLGYIKNRSTELSEKATEFLSYLMRYV